MSTNTRMPGLPDNDIISGKYLNMAAPSTTSPGKRIQLLMPFPGLGLTLLTLASTKIPRHQHTEPPSPTCSGVMSLTTRKATRSYVTLALAAHALSFQHVSTDVFDLTHGLSYPSRHSMAKLLKQKFIWHSISSNTKCWARASISC